MERRTLDAAVADIPEPVGGDDSDGLPPAGAQFTRLGVTLVAAQRAPRVGGFRRLVH
jgi:hypothetical protein